MNLRKISDEMLWSQTASLAERERRITLELLAHFREIEARGLHLDRGYPSLYEYAVRELKLSEGAAYRRVQAMQLLKDIPEAEGEISSGKLSLTTAAKVQNAYRRATVVAKRAALQSLAGKTTREVDRALAAHAGNTSREYARWVSAEEVQLTVYLAKPTFEGLTELQSLRAHTRATPTYGNTVTELVALGQEKWNPLQRKAPLAPVEPCVNAAKERNPRLVPSALRVAVWRRDGGRCTYQDPTSGRRCESRHYLQIDHIKPFALGGTAELENLRLLCGQHNRRRAEKTYGPRPGS